MPESDLVTALNHQLAKYDAAIAEFSAVEAQLQLQPRTPRVVDMLRINRETINAIERSAELVRERLAAAATSRRSAAPFSSTQDVRTS
jgi:hypothetical protein